jgi:hypothetical protein
MAIAADSLAAGPLPERNVTLRLTFFTQPQNLFACRFERVWTISSRLQAYSLHHSVENAGESPHSHEG